MHGNIVISAVHVYCVYRHWIWQLYYMDCKHCL